MDRLEAARSFSMELGRRTPLLWVDPATVEPGDSSGDETDLEGIGREFLPIKRSVQLAGTGWLDLTPFLVVMVLSLIRLAGKEVAKISVITAHHLLPAS